MNQSQILATEVKDSVGLCAISSLVSLLPQQPVVAKMFPMSSKTRHICAITAHVTLLCWQWTDVIINNCRQTTVQSPAFWLDFASYTIDIVDSVSDGIKSKWSACCSSHNKDVFLIAVISTWTLFSWAYLEVTTSSRYNDSLQAYAAGAVEAAVTSQVNIVLLRPVWFCVKSI